MLASQERAMERMPCSGWMTLRSHLHRQKVEIPQMLTVMTIFCRLSRLHRQSLRLRVMSGVLRVDSWCPTMFGNSPHAPTMSQSHCPDEASW